MDAHDDLYHIAALQDFSQEMKNEFEPKKQMLRRGECSTDTEGSQDPNRYERVTHFSQDMRGHTFEMVTRLILK